MAEEQDKAVEANGNNDHLVQSSDPEHPANLIPDLCRRFYNWGWVTGTGGGVSYYSFYQYYST
jgi:methylthioribulose-1-phosphate dehydratase